MKMNSMRKLLALIGCIVLIAAAALTTGCSSAPAETTAPVETTAPTASGEAVVLGEGEKVFAFTVAARDARTAAFALSGSEVIGVTSTPWYARRSTRWFCIRSASFRTR